MSIKITEKGGGKVDIEMDNGHVEALKKITKEYNLKSDSEAMYFMLALLSQANGNAIEINGTKYVPPDSFKNNP